MSDEDTPTEDAKPAISNALESPQYEDAVADHKARKTQRVSKWVDGYNDQLAGHPVTHERYKAGTKRYDDGWLGGWNAAAKDADSDAVPVAAPEKKKKSARGGIPTMPDGTEFVPFIDMRPFNERPNTGQGGSTARIFGRQMGRIHELVEDDGTKYDGALTMCKVPRDNEIAFPAATPELRKGMPKYVHLIKTGDGRWFDCSGIPFNEEDRREYYGGDPNNRFANDELGLDFEAATKYEELRIS